MTALLVLSSGASAACQGREITHAAGVTCVPKMPRRVVVLDVGPLDTALALGIKPVGAVSKFADSDNFVSYLNDRTGGIQNVGIITQPSLERILALKPDLILSSKVRHGELYTQLSRIAPTVLTESVGATWRENLLLWGDALGKKAQAQTLLNRFRVRAKTVGQKHRGVSISVVRFLPGQTRIMHRASFIGTILDEAGLSRPASQRVNDFAAMVSQEAIPQMDASSLFYTTWGDPKTTTQSEMMQSPLWKSLGAVKAGRAFSVDDDFWMTGTGILAANRVLDDLEKFLK
ncbi:ABC transporter substrate-binding protein [Deinococcus phoenicis]|uniref:ABC transporter substrate-binding protein n=1 Tax=Deinococcus phoenicis TaxID=1476583 RepID=UPI001F31DFD7|nr:iron-siderophore ABC transporter substrate-binding protein [Deinococcus phoenicis]